MSEFSKYNIDSAEGIRDYLTDRGITIEGVSALDSSQNVIRLKNYTTLNWKGRNNQIRLNCKQEIKTVVEQNTGFEFMENGVGDPTRPYSLLMNTPSEFFEVVEVLKRIDEIH